MAEAVDDLFSVFSENTKKKEDISSSFVSSSFSSDGVAGDKDAPEKDTGGDEDADEEETKERKRKKAIGQDLDSGVHTPQSPTNNKEKGEKSETDSKEEEEEEEKKKKKKKKARGEEEEERLQENGDIAPSSSSSSVSKMEKEKSDSPTIDQQTCDTSTTQTRKKRKAEREDEKEEEEEEGGGNSSSSDIIVRQLAEDLNCLHEVVYPVDCPTRFVYFPFETTLPGYRTKSSKSSSSSSGVHTPATPREENPAEDRDKEKEEGEGEEEETIKNKKKKRRKMNEGGESVNEEGDESEEEEEKKSENSQLGKEEEGKEGQKVPARQYKFKLDTFQQRSVLCLEAGESVLVSAHTSAGKTVVAEYAIAMSIRDKQRVVYTSPIKALSNQKYRDLCEIFGSDNVGLMTGDVTLHPTASIVVMTTEILRSMLYRGSQLIHELKWLIFDEIHYMRDRERGVVWEESIVLVPSTVRFVFLSATIPNAREFSQWISSIKHQPCHVLYTDYRPTPLQHYMFPAGGEGVYLVMDEKKKFREENFHKAVATLQRTVEEQAVLAKQNPRRGGGSRHRSQSTKSSIERIILMCHARHYTPVIVFCFSKRECEANAMSLLKSSSTGGKGSGRGSGPNNSSSSGSNGRSAAIDLTTDEEKKLIREIFTNALQTLEEEDRDLPQVKSILPLLERGVGIHHGGLLPFIKEIIEILFQESLLRVLFSTETFSMGVNMPAKTVVFTAIRKFDGLEYRIVNSGEYIQMAGRAGRRGLDDRGIVIIMFDEQVDPEEAKQLFMGQASPLLSTFHLGFNMLLNLFRIEDANPSFMITRSFAHFQRNRRALQLEKEKDELQQKVKEAEGDIHALALVDEEHRPTFDVDIAIRKYYELKHDLDQVNHQLRELIMQEKYIVRYLQAGRIIRLIEEDGTDWGWSTCVSKITRKYLPSTNAVLEAAVEELVIHCIVACDSGDTPDQSSSSSSSSSSNHSTHDKSQKKSNESSKENGVGSKGQGSRREKEGKEGDSGPSAEKNSHGSNVSLLHKLRPARRKVRSNADASPDRKDYILKVLPFPLRAIQSISKCRMTIPPGVDVEHSQDLVKSLYFQFKKVEDKFAEEGGLPLLDPIEDMHISEPKLKTLKSQAERLQEELQKNPFFNHPLCEVYFNAHEERMWMETKLRKLHESIDTQRQLVMKDTLRSMRRVLRELEFVDSNDIVTMKGCVACEVTTADELVAAELLFQNVFETLKVEEICAMLSCLVFQEKHDEPEPTEEILLQCLDKVKAVARRIASVCIESRYINPLLAPSSSSRSKKKDERQGDDPDFFSKRRGKESRSTSLNGRNRSTRGGEQDEEGEEERQDEKDFGLSPDLQSQTGTVEDYVNRFQHALMSITYRWAKGEKFGDIIQNTCIYEGTVIRSMRRLEELLRQMACASKTIGNPTLEAKFIEGIKKIRRGIVFSSSLYL